MSKSKVKHVATAHKAAKSIKSTADATLRKLVLLWKSHDARDLTVRHQTGVALNKQFGSPTSRQANGEATLERYARKLNIERSDLTRMRRFAHHFKTLSAFSRKHPHATNWTHVRELLPKLNPTPSNRPKVTAKATTKATAKTTSREKAIRQIPGNQGKPIAKPQQIVETIENARRSMVGLKTKLTNEQRAKLKAALARFQNCIAKNFGVVYRVKPQVNVTASRMRISGTQVTKSASASRRRAA
jgi:hypothetical protein